MPLILEVSADGSEWKQAATLNPGDREGSVSDCRDGRRDVILFRCEPGRSVVYMSEAGMDCESGGGRTVITLGTTELAVLAEGESFERDVTSDHGASYRVRWRHA